MKYIQWQTLQHIVPNIPSGYPIDFQWPWSNKHFLSVCLTFWQTDRKLPLHSYSPENNPRVEQNNKSWNINLTRFNKLAMQGSPQMAVDKEAYRESTHTIISVTCPYSMWRDICLFCSWRYSPLGEWIHSNIQSTLFIHQCEVVPSSYLLLW